MKMPIRPFFPPIRPLSDIFGLEHLSLLGETCETDAERKQRIAKVEAGVLAAFRAATFHLGEDQARQLFSRMARRPKRGRGKALAADRDHRLLKAHDEGIQRGDSIAKIAKQLRADGIELGNTAEAIAAQIRKLIAERKERERAAAREARRWRMATRNEPPTLISAALGEKS